MAFELNALILITLVCWGFWGIFDKLALKEAHQLDVVLIMYLIYIPSIPVVWAACNHLTPGWQPSSALIAWTALAALCHTVSLLAYMHAMSKAEASFVLGITAAYPLVLQFFAVAMLGESLVAERLLGAVLIGLGVFAIGASNERQETSRRADRWVMAACIALATLGWGAVGIFDKKAVSIAHPLQVYLGQISWDVVYLVFLLVYLKACGHQIQLGRRRTWKFCALSSACLMLGAWTFLAALAKSTASYVIVITGCYPLLMYCFAIWFLKEKFNRARAGGIALVVAGGLLVQLTQNM